MYNKNMKYTLLVGNYGSGKTELSIALAREKRKEAQGRIVLVDLDIVNPYFRSAEQAELLRSEGIEVLMPTFAMSTVDIPALPAQIQAIFEDDYQHVFIDVGGDDTGAAALGRYHSQLSSIRNEMQMLYIVNPLRPLSGTKKDIINLFELIASRARFRPTLLVNNANLQNQTTAEHLLSSHSLLSDVSAQLNLPIGMVTGQAHLRQALPSYMQDLYFSFQPLMKPEWLEDDSFEP